jgi:hypothetical protein
MEIDFDGSTRSRDAIFALRPGCSLGLKISKPAKFFGEIVGAETDADVEEITVGINFRWENPLRSLKFFCDGILQLF